ncbi:MAG: hypothetical protein ACXVUE_00300 [Solirubrobacteraceae bacterium]
MAVAVVAGLAFLLLGSGGGSLGSPIAQAATLSSSTPGYRMQMAVRVTSSALSSPVTATGSGVVDLRDHASSMSMAMNLGNDPQVVQALGGSTLRMDMLTDGSDVYVKLPAALTASLPTSGKSWIEVDLSKLSSVPGLSSLAGNPTASDPRQILQSLRSVSDTVVDEGPQRIGRTATTHYHAQLSFSHLADALPPAERGAASKALSALQQALPTDGLPVDVWIDAHHLVRRVVMALDVNLPTGPSLQETVTVDLDHYGPQRRPVAPASSDVLKLNDLPGLGG